MEEGRGDRRTSDGGGGATGESKRNAGGGGRGRHGDGSSGGRYGASNYGGGQRQDRDRTQSTNERDGNGAQPRQGPKRYQEQRRKKDKKKEEETEGEKKVEENPNKERRNTDRNEGGRRDAQRRDSERSDGRQSEKPRNDRRDDKFRNDRRDDRDRRRDDNRQRGDARRDDAPRGKDDRREQDRKDVRPGRGDGAAGGGGGRQRGGGGGGGRDAHGDSVKDRDGEGGGGTRGKGYQENRRGGKDRRRDEAGAPEREPPRVKTEKMDGDLDEDDSPEPKDGGAELMSLLGKNKDKGGKPKLKDKHMKSKGGKSVTDLEAKWQKEEEQRRKKEEEERKAEEEKKRKEEEERLAEEKRIREEEERKKREEEEAARLVEEEKRILQEFIEDWHSRHETKSSMREKNLSAADHRPDDSYFTKLDSSLKKNTAFVKKLKVLSELQKDALTKDFNGLNLTKYVGEAATAITEAKLKMSDIQCALHMCSLLHQRYADFAPALLENWQKVLINKKDDKLLNPSKLRVDLRLFAELVSVGVFTDREGLPVLANQLTCLTQNDKNEHNNLSIILSFCKHCGDDYAGLLPRKIRLLGEKYEREIPQNTFLPPPRQQACRNLLKEYYSSLCKHVIADHKQLKTIEKQNRKMLQTKGELSQDRKEKYEATQTAFQKLISNTAIFSDLLDEDMPELPEAEKTDDDELMAFDVFNPLKTEYTYEGDSSLFEDDDTRMFYENLPDLKAIIPGILYKDSEQSGGTGDTTEDQEVPVDTAEDAVTVEDLEAEMQAVSQLKGEAQAQDGKDAAAAAAGAAAGDVEENVLDELTPDIEDDTDETNQCLKMILDAFLQNLPKCVNRELIDKAAEEFCLSLNTKSNRRKLVRALFTVQRTRYDLLPFYSRLVATLHPCMPDVAADLVFALKGDFRWHVRKKDQINIESKMKTVRFIGELVKFNMFPKSECLHCLKMLLFDFSHHNIEMACAMLDTCGRFLYRSADSHHRTKVYLDLMMRKRAALHLDGRYNTMIENAFYYCNPPEVKGEVRRERPPMHQYIRKILYKDLSKITTEKVLRQMRKLNWDDEETRAYAVKCLSAVWNMRYNSVHCMANLLAGLAPYHEESAVEVIDNVLEDIRVGMEINHPKFNQRRVSAVKYLGELYNYRMVESSVIFKALYTFITFGVTLDPSVVSPLDPPEHLFRVRLTCVLLDTCAQYFDRGSSKKKLDCFLVYFQRYFWFKKSHAVWTTERPFPMDIEYLLRDTIEPLRPKLHICDNMEEAQKAADELDNEFKAKLASILPTLEAGQEVPSEEGEEEEEDGRTAAGLHTIVEEEEMDELNRSLSQVMLSGERSQPDLVATSQGSERDGTPGTGSQSQPLEDEDEDGILFSAGEEEDDDSFTMLSGGPKLISCAEDEDFMSAFDSMLAETIQQRHQEAAKIPQADIAIPMHLKGQKTGSKHELYTDRLSPEDLSSIQFTVLTKRGNKPQTATLNIPISAEFATKFMEREEAERAEKEKMKRVVLDFHERQEEEDYQEMLASITRPVPGSANRERRVRYQHPKGAPDADLIFGSNKR